MGKSHLLLGGAGFLVVGAPVLEMVGETLGAAELAAGTVVCAGASMFPDLDHPSATCARSLGPVTTVLSKATNTLFGGHRQGTHSLLFAGGTILTTNAALAATDGPWLALALAFFFASLCMRVLTEARGAVCMALAAFIAATLITVAPSESWLGMAIGLGCLLHMLGDFLTPEGVPPFWPVSKMRVRIPVVGRTGDWREWVIGSACGLAMCYLMAVSVFLPTWERQAGSNSASSAQGAAQKQAADDIKHAPQRRSAARK